MLRPMNCQGMMVAKVGKMKSLLGVKTSRLDGLVGWGVDLLVNLVEIFIESLMLFRTSS